jgi:hypothetical protein
MIAALSQRYLTPKTRNTLAFILDQSDLRLDLIASWADTIKSQPEYRWTAPYHYINPRIDENPPAACAKSFDDIDNPEINLFSGIQKYAAVLREKAIEWRDRRSTMQRDWPTEEALRFVVHFMGDFEQPLHGTTLFCFHIDLFNSRGW